MNLRTLLFAFSGSLTVSLIMSTTSQAQTSTQPDELQAIYACKTITAAEERLACYDRSVGRFEAAEKSGKVVTVSKTAIEKVERDAFGFNIPSLPSLGRLFGGSDKPTNSPKKSNKESDLTAPIKEVDNQTTKAGSSKPSVINEKPTSSKVTEVKLNIRKTTQFGYKKTRFFMTNGQVWEQADGIILRIPKTRNGKPNVADIRRAALGGFFLRINGEGSAIRVKRVR